MHICMTKFIVFDKVQLDVLFVCILVDKTKQSSVPPLSFVIRFFLILLNVNEGTEIIFTILARLTARNVSVC